MVFQREYIYTLELGLAPVLSSEHQVLQLLSRREGMSKTTYTNKILVLGLFILKTASKVVCLNIHKYVYVSS